jgi:hypothetical protein
MTSPARTNASSSMIATRIGLVTMAVWAVRLAGRTPVPNPVLAERCDDLSELVQSFLDIGSDDTSGLGAFLGRGIRPILQRPGIGGHQREPMGQHVVHLPGDSDPFRGPCLSYPTSVPAPPRLAAPEAQEMRSIWPALLYPCSNSDQCGVSDYIQDQPPAVRQPADRPEQPLHSVCDHPEHRNAQRIPDRAPLRDDQHRQRRWWSRLTNWSA